VTRPETVILGEHPSSNRCTAFDGGVVVGGAHRLTGQGESRLDVELAGCAAAATDAAG
jgi:hypothetical protein